MPIKYRQLSIDTAHIPGLPSRLEQTSFDVNPCNHTYYTAGMSICRVMLLAHKCDIGHMQALPAGLI